VTGESARQLDEPGFIGHGKQRARDFASRH
jgi:hypothetical protein